MDREDLQGTKPVELSTVESLLEFQRNFETGFHFTDKEAEIIIDYWYLSLCATNCIFIIIKKPKTIGCPKLI